MIRVVRNPVFKAPVTIQLPADGGQSEGRFQVHFRALTRSELEHHDLATGAGATGFLREVVRGWDGLANDEGEPFEFDTVNLDLLLDLPHFRVGLVRAYFDTTSGVRSAKLGN